LAGPWTISRDRRDGNGGADLRAELGRLGTWPRRAPPRRLSGSRSSFATTVRPPAIKLQTITRPAVRLPTVKRSAGIASRRGGRSGPAATGRIPAWWAVPLLGVMTATAVFLGLATYHISERAVTASQLAARRVGGPLVIPAPRIAGGFPRRFGAISDPAVLAIVREFRQRFEATGTDLVAGARTAPGPPAPGSATSARDIRTSRTSGLYGEPGHLDPATFRSSWVMYFGLDTTGLLGHPSVTIIRLMKGLLGPGAKVGPWPVASGHRGGSANCTVAWLGQTSVSVCGWATDHTVGALVSPVRDTAVRELAVLMVKMRYDLQRG
jgi:hypothetical protein